MTNRERLLAILEGQSPDRIPWIPRLQLWHKAHSLQGTLPERYRGVSLREIERRLGCGTPARGGGVFTSDIRGVEVTTEQEGADSITRYRTPLGTVTTKSTMTPQVQQVGIHAMEVGHMIKGPEDYRVVEYIVEHTELRPTYDEYLAYEQEIGEDGLPMVSIGYCPMQEILRNYVGYSQAYLHLADYPKEVERLLAVLGEHKREMLKIVLGSPAKLICHCGHFTTTMTPPPIFRKYFLPWFREVGEALHSRGKSMACHADGDTKGLLELIMESGFDMAECFVTAPMVTVTLEEARGVWGNKVIIWGGIPSSILCEGFPEEEFERYMLGMFRTIAAGDAFILGVADNVMPEAIIERVERVSEMVEALGEYPITTAAVSECESAQRTS